MSDDLRSRMRAVFAGKLSNGRKAALPRYNIDSTNETLRNSEQGVTHNLSTKIKAVTPLRPFSANRDSQKGKTCAVCNAAGNLWHYDEALVHRECVRFLPRPEPAESLAYRAVSAAPDGTGCRVQIVELPQAARFRKVFSLLQTKCPALIPLNRWKACVEDGNRFLTRWGEQAEALGWTTSDLFGLAPVPERPHPSFSRLSRYDPVGLCWLLQGRPVVALTESTAAIENPTGNTNVYRRFNKPALGPLGDTLDEFV